VPGLGLGSEGSLDDPQTGREGSQRHPRGAQDARRFSRRPERGRGGGSITIMIDPPLPFLFLSIQEVPTRLPETPRDTQEAPRMRRICVGQPATGKMRLTFAALDHFGPGLPDHLHVEHRIKSCISLLQTCTTSDTNLSPSLSPSLFVYIFESFASCRRPPSAKSQ